MDFSIILINFNSECYIRPCLDWLSNQVFEGSFETIVVNNLSTDNSIDILKARNNITLIDPGKNLGFSKANNLAINLSQGKYVICLNFDCFLTDSFLQTVFDAFESNPDIGMISGKMRKLVDMKSTMYLDSTGIDFTSLVPCDRGEWQYDRSQYDCMTEIFGPSGAAACYRRNALESVAWRGRYFDEQMFTYCEDIDLAWRLNLKGWRGLYIPTALAFHERGATRKDSIWKKASYFYIGFSNRSFAILKNIRASEIKGHFRKLLKQEWKFHSCWGAKSFKKWAVIAAALARLAGLVLRPSFISKRRFAHRNSSADHLDLSLETDIWERSYRQRRTVSYPLNESISDGSAGINVDKSSWMLSTQGLSPLDNEKDALISGKSIGNRSSIIMHIPEDIRDQAKNSLLCIDLEVGGDLTMDLEFYLLDGRTGTSDWRVLSGGKGRYVIDLGKIDVTPGAENILAAEGPWASLKINLSSGPGATIVVRGISFRRELNEALNKDLNLIECRRLPLEMRSKPPLVYAELSTYCNLRCTMCGKTVHGLDGDEQGFMSMQVFENLLELVTPGTRLAMFGRGETLLHPEFERMLEMAKSRRAVVCFNSNGKALTPKIAQAMARFGQDSITLSCSAGTEETYERIHAGGTWDNFWSGVSSLKQAKKRFAPNAPPAIYLEFVSQTQNISELPLLAARAAEWGLNGLIVIDLVAHSDELEKQRTNTPETAHLAERIYLEAVAVVEKLRHVNPHFELRLPSTFNAMTKKVVAGHAAAELEELACDLSEQGDTCAADRFCLEPWQTFYVRFNGVVAPCVITNRVLGDLTRQGSLEVWNGEQFKNFRRRMRSANKPFECMRCHLFPGPQRYDKVLHNADNYEPL